MTKRCPFVVLQECIEDKCAVWRVTPDGVGYCGAGGPPLYEKVEINPTVEIKADDPMMIAIEKQTTDGGRMARQTRRPRS